MPADIYLRPQFPCQGSVFGSHMFANAEELHDLLNRSFVDSEVVVAGLAERVVGSVWRQLWCEVVVRMVVDVGSMPTNLKRVPISLEDLPYWSHPPNCLRPMWKCGNCRQSVVR